MSLLECLVALALSLILVTPLINSSGQFIAKQIEYERVQSLSAEADRALELRGRAIRMAGYRHIPSVTLDKRKKSIEAEYLHLQKGGGFQGSDSIFVKHELSSAVDLDCIGNVLTKDRTKQHLAHYGFLVDRQATAPKGVRVNGGSLICQSLDRQGRIQNTTLMNGVHRLSIEEGRATQAHRHQSVGASRLFTVRIEMTDGKSILREFKRTFATRNLL